MTIRISQSGGRAAVSLSSDSNQVTNHSIRRNRLDFFGGMRVGGSTTPGFQPGLSGTSRFARISPMRVASEGEAEAETEGEAESEAPDSAGGGRDAPDFPGCAPIIDIDVDVDVNVHDNNVSTGSDGSPGGSSSADGPSGNDLP